MNTEMLWRAVATRDSSADDLFVYAVRSTGVYCRPSCPSRRPRRDRVEYFPAPAMARAGGFRPCRRCRPDGPHKTSPAVARIKAACAAIVRQPDRRWTAASLARAAGASPAQLQRGFRASLGLTPRDYLAACRHRSFRDALRNGHAVTDAVYEAGYGSPSRVYEAGRLPGMTPASYAAGGRGARIGWRTVETPVGRVLVAATDRGVCFVELGENHESLVRALRREFPNASVDPNASPALAAWADAVREVANARPVDLALPVDIRGTAFQWRVWRALTRIPAGQTRSYRDVARSIGAPSSARAVARACATNPLALLVPCHRVVRADGAASGYRWGAGLKRALLNLEKR